VLQGSASYPVPLHTDTILQVSAHHINILKAQPQRTHTFEWCRLEPRLHLGQLAAAAALSASVNRLRLGGKSGARLPTNGTFASGSLLIGRLCRNASELCNK
jgi:hypothetical protein